MIICAGESLIDFVPETSDGSHYRPVPGGSPMNCAVTVARLGGSVAFIGTISTDFFGDRIVDHLTTNQVDLSLVSRVPNATTLAFVNTTDSENVRYAFYTTNSADRALTVSNLPSELPPGSLLQIGSISLIGTPSGETLTELAVRHAREGIVALDPNIRANLVDDEAEYRARLRRATQVSAIFKTSEEELRWIFPGLSEDKCVDQLFALGIELVLITRGADGSTARTRVATVNARTEKISVSDTIGAGDSYMGAALCWLDEQAIHRRGQLEELSSAQLSLMLEFAGKVSAFTCTRVGADPPTRAEITP